METNLSYLKPDNRPKNSFIYYFSGFSQDAYYTERTKKNIEITSLLSLTASFVFALCLGWLASLFIGNLVIAILSGVTGGIITSFCNRLIFIQMKKDFYYKLFLILFYILFQIVISLFIVQLFLFEFLSSEIKSLNPKTALETLKAFQKVKEQLNIEAVQSIQNIKIIVVFIFMLLTVLPLLSHFFTLYRFNVISSEQDALVFQSQQKLQELKKQFVELYNPSVIPSDSENLFEEEQVLEASIEDQKKHILEQIEHLQYFLANLV